MFSIPVTGLAKAAIVATISLHPAAAHQAHQAPDHYTVKSGDTADRRGPAGARQPGHRCLAGVRGQRLAPSHRHLPAPVSHQPGAGR